MRLSVLPATHKKIVLNSKEGIRVFPWMEWKSFTALFPALIFGFTFLPSIIYVSYLYQLDIVKRHELVLEALVFSLKTRVCESLCQAWGFEVSLLNILTIVVPVSVVCAVTVHDRCLRKACLVSAILRRHYEPSRIQRAPPMTLCYVESSSATSL